MAGTSKGQPAVLVAVETFVADVDGQAMTVTAGLTRVRSNHPVVKGREELFAPDGPAIEEH